MHFERSASQPWCAAGLWWLALACGMSPLRAGETTAAGEVFPDLAGFELAGELPDLAAARVIIVDFWASWCAPCKASFPVFDELAKNYGPKGLVVVAVSVDQNARAMQAFLARMKPGFSVVHDVKQKLVEAVDIPTMPTSFVLDGKRVVRFVHAGFRGESSRREYIEQIETLLAESP